jgi:hypothetical protein
LEIQRYSGVTFVMELAGKAPLQKLAGKTIDEQDAHAVQMQ